MKLSIVIPVYNEDPEILSGLLGGLLMVLDLRNDEVVIVNDGSDWGYPKTEHITNTRVIKHEFNLGRGAAMRTGANAAKGDVIIWMDGDGEHDPGDLIRMVWPISQNMADIVYGNRYAIHDFRFMDKFWHRSGNRLLTFINSLFTGLDLGDPACGYRAFRREVWESIEIEQNRWGIEWEFNSKVAKLGETICEVPVHYKPRTIKEGKKIRLWHGLQAIWLLFKYNVLTNESPKRI